MLYFPFLSLSLAFKNQTKSIGIEKIFAFINQRLVFCFKRKSQIKNKLSQHSFPQIRKTKFSYLKVDNGLKALKSRLVPTPHSRVVFRILPEPSAIRAGPDKQTRPSVLLCFTKYPRTYRCCFRVRNTRCLLTEWLCKSP